LIRDHHVEQVVLAYSDISHQQTMHLASRVLAAGADFRLMGPQTTMLDAAVPVISVCAVRTGSGKSQTSRRVIALLQEAGRRVVVVRHPMPYGVLAQQAVQRFGEYDDLERHGCTIEEREEYEPHLDRGVIVYAGVDYEAILRAAEDEADVIVWDGGNNDLPFFRPNVHIVVVDPHRPGHELGYHPGEANLRMADVVVINKIDTAEPRAVNLVRGNVHQVNPGATLIEAASPVLVDEPMAIRGRRVLVIEDGPTLTHGDMAYGAGVIAAQRFGAAEIVDPRPYAVGSIIETYRQYPTTGPVLPAMGYGATQMNELEATIRGVPCDLVLVATPIDISRILTIQQPTARVHYELQEIGRPTLKDALAPLLGPSLAGE
jgi:predicted GTPase